MNLLHEPSGNPLAQITPVLDAAIIELSDDDRKAILLRFFEKREFRVVGEAMGINEDAARMRVNRALEKLHSLLQRRGVALSAVTLGTVLAADAVTAAPAGMALTISNAALTTAAAGTGTTLNILKLLTMTKLQAALMGTVLLAAVATPLAIQHHAEAKLRAKEGALQQQTDLTAQLEAENTRLSNLVAQANGAQSLSNEQFRELLRLRGEVERLRGDSQTLAKLKSDPTGAIARVAKIKARLEQMPEMKIPEMQFLTDQEWEMWTARVFGKGETDEDYRYTFSRLREESKKLFARWLDQALHNYADANGGYLPTDLSQLKPYFTPPVHDANWKPGDPVRYELLPIDDAILQRYQLVQTGKLSDVPQVGFYPPASSTGNAEHDAMNAAQREKNKTNLPWTEPVIVEKAPVDEQFDSLLTVTVYGYSYKTFGRGSGNGSGTFAKAVVGTNGVPEMVDPVPAIGRRWSGGGSGAGGGGSFGGGGGSSDQM